MPRKKKNPNYLEDVEVIGCPWCDRVPTFGEMPGIYFYAECQNQKCVAQPRVMGVTIQRVVNDWNKAIIDSNGQTLYTLAYIGEK